MPKHHRVSPNFWQGDRRRWNDQEKLLAQYLLTGPHRNLEGLYFLPKQYISADLSWPLEIVTETLQALEQYGFAWYDDDAEVVFLRNALKHQAPKSSPQVIGACNALEAVPRTHLWGDFVCVARKYAPELAGAIAEGPVADRQTDPRTDPPTHPKPSRDGMGDGIDAEPDTDSEGSLARGSRAHSSNSNSSSLVEPSRLDAAKERGKAGEDGVRLCELLAEKVTANDPKAKVAPESARWLRDMRLLIDDREGDVEEVEQVLLWSQADSFWSSNILSPGKLRQQFTALRGRMGGQGTAAGGAERPSFAAIEEAAERREAEMERRRAERERAPA